MDFFSFLPFSLSLTIQLTRFNFLFFLDDKSPVSKSTTPKDQNTYTSEEFHQLLQSEMKKIEKFTTEQVNIIRKSLSEISSRIDSALLRFTYKRKFDNSFELEEDNDINDLKKELEVIGQNFLQLEKFVNLNYMGFHKILKKNDRRLPPQFSCKAFYLARLHEQSWIRGDNSDIMVTMSRLYSLLRGETLNLPSKNNSSSEKTAAAKAAAENEQQNFVRSTKKYWVHMENISKVKYMVLQNLPVFLQKTMAGETDSQLINSVYLDNFSMELYHGRLEKTPGAIALRFRWYGDKTPEEDPSVVVFVERKTHRESWAGDVSVKERFIISESQVIPLLKGKFDQETEIKKMEKKGKSEKEINEWKQLVNEVVQAINSKQLLPTMRTQYMRTAFQIPFDASVRISLDTNLCMILDRTKETLQGLRWFRSSSTAIPPTQITRFPHAVLEIKLQLEDESKTPLWVNELIHSGMLLEVHKFSKFIHGCAVLLPEDVRAMPYWIDDVTLADSIHSSGAGRILEKSVGANQEYRELLPHDQEGNVKIRPAQLNYLDYQKEKEEGKIKVRESPFIGYELCREYCDNQYCDWAFSADAERMTIQKVSGIRFIIL